MLPSSPPKVIAFGHRRGRGKDVAARHVASRTRDTEHPFYQDCFARSLKTGVGSCFDFSSAQLFGERKEELDPFWQITPRDALQRAGVAFRQTFGLDFWVRTLLRRVTLLPARAGVVISDLRFLNEAQALRDVFGARAFLIRLDRDVPHNPAVDDHESETSLLHFDDWDTVIDNNRSLPELYQDLDGILKTAGVFLNRQLTLL